LDKHLTSRDSSVDVPAALTETSRELTVIKEATPKLPPMHLIMALIHMMNQHAESMRDQNHADIKHLTGSLKYTMDELIRHLATHKEPEKTIPAPKAHTTDNEDRDTPTSLAQQLAGMENLGASGTDSSEQKQKEQELARLEEAEARFEKAKAKVVRLEDEWGLTKAKLSDEKAATLKPIFVKHLGALMTVLDVLGRSEDKSGLRGELEELKGQILDIEGVEDAEIKKMHGELIGKIDAELAKLSVESNNVHSIVEQLGSQRDSLEESEHKGSRSSVHSNSGGTSDLIVDQGSDDSRQGTGKVLVASDHRQRDRETKTLAEEQRLEQGAKAKLDDQTAILKRIREEFQSMDDGEAKSKLEGLSSSLDDITDGSLAGERAKLLWDIQARLESLTNPSVETHLHDDTRISTAIEEKDESATKLESIREQLESLMSEVDLLVQSEDESDLRGKLEELKGQIQNIEDVENAAIREMRDQLIGKIDTELAKPSAESSQLSESRSTVSDSVDDSSAGTKDVNVDGTRDDSQETVIESGQPGLPVILPQTVDSNGELTEDSVKAKLAEITTVAEAHELDSLVKGSHSLTNQEKETLATKIREKIDDLNNKTKEELQRALESVDTMDKVEVKRLMGKYSEMPHIPSDLEELRVGLLNKLRERLNPTETDAVTGANSEDGVKKTVAEMQNLETLGGPSDTRSQTVSEVNLVPQQVTGSITGGDTGLEQNSKGSGSFQDEEEGQEVGPENLNGSRSDDE